VSNISDVTPCKASSSSGFGSAAAIVGWPEDREPDRRPIGCGLEHHLVRERAHQRHAQPTFVLEALRIGRLGQVVQRRGIEPTSLIAHLDLDPVLEERAPHGDASFALAACLGRFDRVGARLGDCEAKIVEAVVTKRWFERRGGGDDETNERKVVGSGRDLQLDLGHALRPPRRLSPR
jgi:hypothetical protein